MGPGDAGDRPERHRPRALGAAVCRGSGRSIENRGTIQADVSGQTIFVGGIFSGGTPTPTVTNFGTVRAAAGGEVACGRRRELTNLTGLTLSGSTYTGTLTGGTWDAAGGTIRVFQGTDYAKSFQLASLAPR